MCENFLGKFPHNETVQLPFTIATGLQNLLTPVTVKVKALLPQNAITFEVGVLGSANIAIDMKKLPVNKESVLEFYIGDTLQEFTIGDVVYTKFKIFSEITVPN